MKAPQEILEGLTDEQREMVMEGYRKLDGPSKEEQAPWTQMARKKLFSSSSHKAGSSFYGYWSVTEYELTPLGNEVRALIVAEEAVKLAALKESLGTVQVPAWMLLCIAECKQGIEFEALAHRAGQTVDHTELRETLERIARGEA